MVLSAIHNEVANAKFYSISANEARDNSRKEILSVMLRYYNTTTLKVKEAFTGFVYLEQLGAEHITLSLKGCCFKSMTILLFATTHY